jgi:UDP-GlcNAc:undecaprenyl-phosphate/decaprenyl-phosphate GlcNAc-1-phosphate transferase
MSLWAAVVTGAFTGVAGGALLISWESAPAAMNHRGARVPVVLGSALASGAAGGIAAFALTSPEPGLGALAIRVSAGAALVFAAGLVDDLVADGTRGLRAHLRALASGHVTTGAVKLLVVTASSIIVVAGIPRRATLVDAASVVLIAGSSNLLNGLDVAPGRALKAFLVAAVAVLIGGLPVGAAPLVPSLLGAGAGILSLDLRERAMLGDGGANLLGFAAGVGLALVLPDWGLIVAASAVVGLNLVAETLTLSALIDRAAPLRWFDRLGRLPVEG